MTDFNDDLLELPSDEESSAHAIGSWIISYGDLMTVLVVFFFDYAFSSSCFVRGSR